MNLQRLSQFAKTGKCVLALKLSVYQTEKPHSDFRGHIETKM